jgi:hypothetical protein
MEVCIDQCVDAPAGEREFSHPLNLIANSHTTAAKNALVPISLKKRGSVIGGEGDEIPGVLGIVDSILIDQALKTAFSFFFASWAGHGMVEENQLKLNLPGFDDFWRTGENLHPVFGRSETGWEKLRLSLLLDHTESAGAEGDQPPVIAQGGDPDISRPSSLKDGLPLLNLYRNTVNH